MFNKEKFSNILKKILNSYNSIQDFANHANMDRGYLSRNINNKLDNPPSPKILKSIADSSKGVTSYIELMEICGYIKEVNLTFDKEGFSKILKQINSKYTSMTEFAKSADFDRTYISKGINSKLQNPPTPEILKKIANSSKGVTSYMELMQVCGYLGEDYIYPEFDTRYNQGKLIKILKQMQGDKSLNDFAKNIDVDSSTLSRIMTYNRTNPPSPMTLRKIANSSNGIATYVELLLVCGYLTEEDIIEINSNKVEDDNKLCVDLEISNLRIPNFEETEEKVKNLVSLLERADELIKSLSKK